MKLQILQEDLSKILNTSIRFISNKRTLPILGNFLLKAEKSKLIIEATNLEMSISCSIGAKVEKEGSVTVPAKLFQELIVNLEHGQINLSSNKEQLEIQSSSFKGSLPTMAVNDFPTIPNTIDAKKSFTLPEKDLSNSLSKVLFSSSTDETRPILTGVLFIFDAPKATNSSLTLVASDGFRLSQKSVSLTKKVEDENLKLIIPRSTLLELIKISAGQAELSFELRQSDNQLIIKIDDIYLSTRLINGDFPDFEKIIPKSSSTIVTVNKNDLSRGIKLASVFARDEGGIIKMTVNVGVLQISSENAIKGKQNSQIDASVEGPNVDISFNYKFIEDFLNNSSSDNIEIKLTDSVSPSIWVDSKDPDFLHLIMPVRVQS
jgi:DNA polymerase-3 subunit beta